MARLRPLPLRQLARDQHGVTVVEFALVCPVFLMTLLGMFDLSYNIYTASLLEGSIQKAARDATIEGSDATVDNRVRRAVQEIVPDATLTITRRAYANYANINRPEDFTDLDANSTCNDGEPFEDLNGNGRWDTDVYSDGQGNAREAVLYEVAVTYDRAFPIDAFVPGLAPQVEAVARTVLRNQPYGVQDQPGVGEC